MDSCGGDRDVGGKAKFGGGGVIDCLREGPEVDAMAAVKAVAGGVATLLPLIPYNGMWKLRARWRCCCRKLAKRSGAGGKVRKICANVGQSACLTHVLEPNYSGGMPMWP